VSFEQTYDGDAGITGEPDPLVGEGIAGPVLPRPTADLLSAYLGTEVVDGDRVVWSGSGAVAGLEETWVITAENPFSELREPAENAAANQRLVATIEAAGFATTALVGRAPDLSWSEDCVAVRGATLAQVCTWGRAYDQHAVFLLTHVTHAVVSCWSGQELGRRPRVLAPVDLHRSALRR
jgi:hypothetical protein